MAAYPLVRVPLDAPQLALLRALRDRIGERWRWRYEVPIPLPGDLRAADAVLSAPSGTVLVEAETRLVDVQATLRAANLKRRDIGADRLVLLVAGSRANRRALSEAAGRAVDPLGLGTRTTRTVVRQLRAGELPAADAVVLL